MTAPVPTPGPPREWLEPGVGAIECGNWRYVRCDLDPLDAYGDAAALYVLLQVVALTMRLQTLGQVTEAWRQLGDAAQLLPRAMRRLSRDGITPVVVLRRESTSEVGVRLLTQRVARVIFREQAELAALKMSLVRKHTTARDVLIDAMIEWMRWVECDPRTGDPRYAGEDLPGTGPTRAEFCGRATRLRRFADPTAGDVSTTVWTNLDGYFGLRGAALRRLAASELVPWRSANPLIVDTPVRLGRRRAWEHATQWLADL